VKLKQEISVGALTLVGLAVLILGFKYLKGDNVFTREKTFVVNFADVTGLYESNAIMANGHEVGRVKDISMSKDPNYQVLVTLQTSEDIFIPEDSKFKIISVDLLSKKGIAIEMGKSNQSVKEGVIYASEPTKDMFAEISSSLSPVTEKAAKLMDSLNFVITDLHNAIGRGEASALKQTFSQVNATLKTANHSLQSVTAVLDKNSGKINSIVSNTDSVIANFNTLSGKLASNSSQIDKIVANAETLTSNLAKVDIEKTVNDITKTIQDVNKLLSQITDGNGTISKIIKEEGLYNNIDSTISSLNFLLQDLQKNPKRYVHFSLIDRNKD
jgi:phospholipid/cholesterol/gamma-HCH transport system substrate-binding protein